MLETILNIIAGLLWAALTYYLIMFTDKVIEKYLGKTIIMRNNEKALNKIIKKAQKKSKGEKISFDLFISFLEKNNKNKLGDEIAVEVHSYDGHPIVLVDSGALNSDYDISDIKGLNLTISEIYLNHDYYDDPEDDYMKVGLIITLNQNIKFINKLIDWSEFSQLDGIEFLKASTNWRG